jgi:hypothetical protein
VFLAQADAFQEEPIAQIAVSLEARGLTGAGRASHAEINRPDHHGRGCSLCLCGDRNEPKRTCEKNA